MNWDLVIHLLRDHRGRFDLCTDEGNFCALGAIGYGAMGKDFFDEAVKSDAVGYDMLEKHPAARKMIAKVAELIRFKYPEFVALNVYNTDDDMQVVYTFNDSKPTSEVVHLFEQVFSKTT